MKLLDGKQIKLEMLNKLKEDLTNINEKLTLAVVQVGNDEASSVYVKQKEKMASNIGMQFKHFKLDENITNEEIFKLIDELNNDKNITGIIVQLPLPKHLNALEVQNKVDKYKDVDGLSDINIGKLMHFKEDALAPCTALGIINILKYYNIEIEGKNVCIVGRSDLVGKPLIPLLLEENATISICHSKTKNLKEITRLADILIVAVGKANLINSDYIKEGSTLIDVGINRLDGKLCGDIDFESVKDKCAYITPVPGGVGPMTIAMLMENTVKAAINKQ